MNNLEYLYNHLPSRFRRDDKDLFLKRFLQFSGETLDGYDIAFDEFFEQIDPQTARSEFVEFWLREMFGWSWFPQWFTGADKRTLYGNFARHLARRGTPVGIETFLADFYISATVHKSPQFYESTVWGEPLIFVSEPLFLIVQIEKIAPPSYRQDFSPFEETFYEESFYSDFEPLYTKNEVEDLLRYEQPQSQEIVIYNRFLGANNE